MVLGRGLEEGRTKSWRDVPSGMPAGDAWHSTQLLNTSTFASFSLKNWGTYCLKAPGSPLPRQSETASFPKAGQRAVVLTDKHASLGSGPGAVTFVWPQRSQGQSRASCVCTWEDRDAQTPAVRFDSCCNFRGSEIRCYLYRKSQCSDFPNNFLLNDPTFRSEEREH